MPRMFKRKSNKCSRQLLATWLESRRLLTVATDEGEETGSTALIATHHITSDARFSRETALNLTNLHGGRLLRGSLSRFDLIDMFHV